MSSHHFVKEGQEPALLIIEPINFQVIEPLLEWAPQIIVFQHALDEVILWGIKIDVVIAANDNIEMLKQNLASQTPVKIVAPGGSDVLETALYFLITTKQEAVNILVNEPSHFFDKLEGFLDKISSICLLTDTIKWSAIGSGVFKKWLPGGYRIFVHSASEFQRSENLKRLSGHYEVVKEGFITLAADGPFWVGEPDKN